MGNEMAHEKRGKYYVEDWALADAVAQGILSERNGDIERCKLVMCMSMILIDNSVAEDPQGEGFYAFVQNRLRELKFATVTASRDYNKPRN
jgi:hypothetical protein